MNFQESHIPDQDLLLHLEGELSARDAKRIASHIAGCWTCRSRHQQLDQAIAEFVHGYQKELEVPSAEGPRALLKARIAEVVSQSASRSHNRVGIWAIALASVVAIGLVLAPWIIRRFGSTLGQNEIVAIPDARLTPGAALLVNRNAVCAQPVANNKSVPAAVRRAVFREYGITGADPRAYEVDYLVTPALGGSDDIHNLWPHSYSATVWNARVKDALENRLREMVCNGSLDLPEAQREIAQNWIAAYKKYFHTEHPLTDR